MKLDGKSIIWPADIDSTKTRKEGRKVPKSISIESPKLEEIKKALENLGYKYESSESAARPNFWWEKTGYLIVERGGKPKSSILKEISKKLKPLRSKTSKLL